MRPHLLYAALCAVASVFGLLPALAAPPGVDDYARPPAISGVRLSPSGQRLAMVVTDGRDGRRALAVLDLPPKAAPRIVASYGDADVHGPYWVNENRLVYQAYEPGAVLREGGGGTFAVDHDGSNRLTLIAATMASGPAAGSRIASRALSFDWRPLGPARGGNGNEILVQQGTWTTKSQFKPGRMARLDTVTGQLTPYIVGAPPGSHSWIFDSRGEPRVARITDKGRDQLFLRTSGSNEWSRLSDVDENSHSVMAPLALESDSELVVASRAGKDTYGLYVFDLKTGKLQPDPIASVARYDIKATGTDGQGERLSWATLDADRPTHVWFTERMATLQKSLDASLPPGRINDILCTECERSAFYVVRSYSDQHPGEYLIYDPAAGKLLPLGPAYPNIDPSTQGKRSFHWIKARDGLPLSLVVTHPPGSHPKTPLPTVVLVHGGPWVGGDTVAWEAESQFLASRGWRVIQPNFRGSLGYGRRHFHAGFKQWGLAMQDDLSDALKWAVDEGLSDPKRACIYGASYGGYAALMGPVRDPGLYRCAVSLVGVTDLMLLFSSFDSDVSDDWKSYGARVTVGNPDTERDRLDANSPVHRVADIKVPVLLAAGMKDRRVPRQHADDFESAARKAGVRLERIDYAEEGHGFSLPKNRADFWTRLDAFMARAVSGDPK